MPDPVTAGVVGGTSVISSLIGADAAGDAASTAASSADAAAQLQYAQYEQSRQDMLPYMEAAVGEPIYATQEQINADKQAYLDANPDVAESGLDALEHYLTFGQNEGREWFGETTDYDQPIDYTGGALNEYADYGPSQVDVQSYLPGSEVPVYDVNGNIVKWEDTGQIPEYGEVDIFSDPSYQFRLDESLGAVDAAAASMGEVVSGNRLYDVMDTAGEMASQEYAAAYGRNVTDYDIARQAESEQYGRDVFGYEAATQEEATQFGRDLTEFGYDVEREQEMYNRGLGLYGVDYGQEADYLNRLAAVAGLGQTSTAGLANVGAQTAGAAGDALIASGQAQAAGDLGQANAITGAIGDMTSIYAMSQYQPYPDQMYYNNYDSGYYTSGPQPPPWGY